MAEKKKITELPYLNVRGQSLFCDHEFKLKKVCNTKYYKRIHPGYLPLYA